MVVEMNPYTPNPTTEQGIQEPLLDFELFFRYKRNRYVLQHSSERTDKITNEDSLVVAGSEQLSQTASQHQRELYRRHVQRLLNVSLPQDCLSMSLDLKIFKEHIRHEWSLANEPNKSVFRQLAHEWQNSSLSQENKVVIKRRKSKSKASHMNDDIVVAHCPIIHSPKQPNKRSIISYESPPITKPSFQDQDDIIKKNTPQIEYPLDHVNSIQCPIVHSPVQPNKPPATFSRRDRNLNHGPLINRPSHTKKNRKRRREDSPDPKSSDENERSGLECCNSDKPPALVRLTGIISLVDREDGIDSRELRRFLSELDWDKLYEGDETETSSGYD